MILIVDAGSTKGDWIFLEKNGAIFLKTKTKGLNPTVFEKTILEKNIHENYDLQQYRLAITQLYFYGAGCGTTHSQLIIKEVLEQYFTKATVFVKEDMAAAVFSVTTTPGIVCILGTGSNSCYFDGEKIHTVIPALGYTLMDEASGNYFGKKLLCDFFYEKMPKKLAIDFNNQFDLNEDEIKLNLYKKENPNTYLASFASFIFDSDMQSPYFKKMVKKGIKKFFTNRVTFYKNKKVPLYFVGSIAYLSADIIHKVAKEYNYTIGGIVQRPIDGLVAYHQKK